MKKAEEEEEEEGTNDKEWNISFFSQTFVGAGRFNGSPCSSALWPFLGFFEFVDFLLR